MPKLFKKISQKIAENREIKNKLDNLTDNHFFTIVDFAKNYELNTGKPATKAEIQQLRSLL